jgi:hypothetical protein
VKKSLPNRILLESSNDWTAPFNQLATLTGDNERQSFDLAQYGTGNLGLEFNLTTVAFTLITSVISIFVMALGADLFPGAYKNTGLRVRAW